MHELYKRVPPRHRKKKNDIYIYLYEEYIYNKKKKNDKYVMYLNGMWYMVLHICT